MGEQPSEQHSDPLDTTTVSPARSRRRSRELRSFLIQVIIVIIGVLIALGVNEMADDLRWNHEVVTGRAALHAEMSENARFYQWRISIADCLGRRLDLMNTAIENASAHRPTGVSGVIGTSIGASLDDQSWQTQRASQTLTHFPTDELLSLGQYYAENASMRSWVVTEENALTTLRMLDDSAGRLHDSDITALRQAIQTERDLAGLIAWNSRRRLAEVQELGVQPPPVDKFMRNAVAKVCTPSVSLVGAYLD